MEASHRAVRGAGGEPPPRGPEAGFSLVELVISILLASLITGAVLAALITQSRFVENLSASTDQNEEVRSGLLLLTAEIADLTTGAVSAAEPDSFAFRYPLFWGVMCGPEKQDKPEDEDHGFMWLGGGFDPKEYEEDGDLSGFAVYEDDVWTYFEVDEWSDVKIKEKEGKARDLCLGKEKDIQDDSLSAEEEEYYKFEKMVKDYMQEQIPGDTVPKKGSLVTLYAEISYAFRDDPEGDGVLLFRGGPEGAYSLVGPFAQSAKFRYRLADGQELSQVTGASLEEIRQIQAQLPALKRRQPPGISSDSLLVTPWIQLQNAR